MLRTARPTRLVVAVALVAALAACGNDDPDEAATTSAPEDAGLDGEITVLAASSLTDSFTALADEFEAEHPDTTITLSFGASSDLVAQITEGAPADVFAPADETNMAKVVDAGAAAGDPVPLVGNRLAIAVEDGNPLGLDDLADLADPDLVVVLCAAEVPCGKLADQVLSNAGVTVTPSSREANVKATLAKVELGEADAAIVYVTDVRASGEVTGVTIPDDVNVITTIPIVPLADSTNAELAAAWVDFVAAHTDQLVEEYGFLPL